MSCPLRRPRPAAAPVGAQRGEGPGLYFTGRGAHCRRAQPRFEPHQGSGLDGRITKKDAWRQSRTDWPIPGIRPPPVNCFDLRKKFMAPNQWLSRARRASSPHTRAALDRRPHAALGADQPACHDRHGSRHGPRSSPTGRRTRRSFRGMGSSYLYTADFAAASIAALKAVPVVNASWSDDGIVLHPTVNLGVAVSMGDDGLIVPVIKAAEVRSRCKHWPVR